MYELGNDLFISSMVKNPWVPGRKDASAGLPAKRGLGLPRITGCHKGSSLVRAQMIKLNSLFIRLISNFARKFCLLQILI